MARFRDLRAGPIGLVLMTALPPTIGHEALIRFGHEYMKSVGGHLVVLMGVLPDEPGGRADHFEALRDCFPGASSNLSDLHFTLQFGADPQGPKGPDDDEFWAHWVKVVMTHVGRLPQYVFSSETYGYRLARSLDAQHVIFDPQRGIAAGVQATHVRLNPVSSFRSIVKPLRDQLRGRITIFGPESCGKTTLSRALALHLDCVVSPEWARPYLESLPDGFVNQEPSRMTTIMRGQAAQELVAERLAEDRGDPFVFLDTDLLTTIGFEERRRPRGGPGNRDYAERWGFWNEMDELYRPADLYLLASDGIEFTPDPLRYGGTKRETNTAYWEGILQARSLPYHRLPAGTASEVLDHAMELCRLWMEAKVGFYAYERSR